jgi:hypothetical protein
MSDVKKPSLAEQVRGDMYGMETLKWYGWGSPVGLGMGLISVGLFLWLLHLASIIK